MEKQMKRYVALSYIVFWFMVLGLCGTASMVFHCSPVVMRVLSNVCAWAPTIVLLIGFNFLYCFLKVDIWFYAILSVVYILIIALICLKKKADNAVKNRS